MSDATGIDYIAQQYESIRFITRAIRLSKDNLTSVLELTGQKPTGTCSQEFLEKYDYVKFPTPNQIRLTTVIRVGSWVCFDEFDRIFSMTDYEFRNSFRIVED